MMLRKKLAVLTIKKFPNHQFAWKILGALYIQTNKPSKSLFAAQKSSQLKPHIHDQGWLSGSIYINAPSKHQSDSGNLVVCIGNDKESNSIHSIKRKIDIVAGSLVLFPASLTHYTIPFESSEECIVLAFDVNS